MEYRFDADRPIYIQLQERVKTMIVTGEYAPGEKIPAVRELAERAEVNPNTLQKALSELEREGLLYSQRTSGRFVTEDTEKIAQLKQELAGEHSDRFFKGMESIGIGAAEAVDIIKEKLEEK